MSQLVPQDLGLVSPSGVPVGLEDFDASDQVMPLLQIDHHRGTFVNKLTSQEFEVIEAAVILGLVKQRVLWPADLQDNSKELPLCRSYDFRVGHPRIDVFPWEASGFSQTNETLPCQSCKLKDWKSHPKRDNAPWCSEQHTLPMLILAEGEELAPVILSVQRSGLKNAKSYASYFRTQRLPLFTVYTRLSLEKHKMGSNPYCVPTFGRGAQTPIEEHQGFATMYMQIRDFLQTPWSGSDEESDDVDSMDIDEPVSASPEPATATRSPLGRPSPSAPVASVADDPDDLPF